MEERSKNRFMAVSNATKDAPSMRGHLFLMSFFSVFFDYDSICLPKNPAMVWASL